MNDETDPLRTEGPQAVDKSDEQTAAFSHVEHIGRYRVDHLLGQGGFGRVYLARDGELDRQVAIKLPHPKRAAGPAEKSQFLVEARALAHLDHPAIVPVYDFGTTDEGCCYIVSKYIDGGDLASLIRKTAMRPDKAARLVATIAYGLHHAHTNGLFHRDVKPGNILIDHDGHPFVTDFGLALREEDTRHGYAMAGTPAYMSPEQARGEGHRVDGRSDIFSLGVVFYEMLTGRRPHKKWDSLDDLLNEIISSEVRPPRQLNDQIPRELERICLKALSERAVDRYTTAKDLADDLMAYLETAPEMPESAQRHGLPAKSGSSSALSNQEKPLTHSDPDSQATPSYQRPLEIVPKGLRAFDANDAYFFLELLPGVRDRDGLPDVIRFWKLRIESADDVEPFAVGLIYGPSGCGKSSLVRAGLLPRLSDQIISFYFEATPDQTESQLLHLLRQRFPLLDAEPDLTGALMAVRRGEGIPAGQKVLLVLDQFEQWLHAHRDPHDTPLVSALRQCDGGRLQCILMVRDDFWMAATRFMKQLEIRIVEGVNSAAADRFDLRHARKVLTAFGRAYHALPNYPTPLDKEQESFLDRALAELAEDEQVIPVRLTLFAEMLKGKPWSPATLKALGGIEGVGIAFLRGTFDGRQAPPEHRHHQKAIRGVLHALLPEHGGDIKGHQRSHAELLVASGYLRRPDDFDEVLSILDQGVRLVTPTDSEPPDADPGTPGQTHYQLAHDYLVPSIREWLNQNQRQSWSGRAELRLLERTSLWSSQREAKQLPSLVEWSRLRLLTRRSQWSPESRQMMQVAAGYHVRRGLMAIACLLLLAVVGTELRGRWRASQLCDRLATTGWAELPSLNAELLRDRRWTEPRLRQLLEQAQQASDEPQQLRASLSLLPMDVAMVDDVFQRALAAEPDKIAVLTAALRPHHRDWEDEAWNAFSRPDAGADPRRLRAAALLTAVAPTDTRWETVGDEVADRLVGERFVRDWVSALRPARDRFRGRLTHYFAGGDADLTPARKRAGELLIEFYADDAPALVALLPDAHESHFSAIVQILVRNHPTSSALVAEQWATQSADIVGRDDAQVQRKANCGIALITLGQGSLVWPALTEIEQPDLRNWLIDKMAPLGVDPMILIQRFRAEQDVVIRRALLLALGEYPRNQLPSQQRDALVSELGIVIRDDPDPGIHSAAQWLLSAWDATPTVTDQTATEPSAPNHRWQIAAEGHVMVVVQGPVEFWMGSPESEPNRVDSETRHRRRLDRTFAIASKEVTVAQFHRFLEDAGVTDFSFRDEYAPSDDCPQIDVTWYRTARYCNWLSEQAGIPPDQWSYLPNEDGEFDTSTRMADGYLHKTGFRLPSEAEWEYVCRAYSTTTASFGSTTSLASKYARHLDNDVLTAWPVGSLKPNELGLFDMLGNAYEWTLDSESNDPAEPVEQIRDDLERTDLGMAKTYVTRGGSFASPVDTLRCASRIANHAPNKRNAAVGFRVARTLRAD